MALVRCPECDSEVSEKANACPKCGNPLQSAPVETEKTATRSPRRKIILAISIVVIAMASFIFYNRWTHMPAEEKEAIERKLTKIITPKMKGSYRVTIVSAKIDERKKDNGKAWDSFNGNPDVVVILSIGGNRLETLAQKNTLNPKWNKSGRMRFMSGDENVQVHAYDKDALKHDIIGECRKGPLDSFSKDGNKISIDCGQMKDLVLTFEKIGNF